MEPSSIPIDEDLISTLFDPDASGTREVLVQAQVNPTNENETSGEGEEEDGEGEAGHYSNEESRLGTPLEDPEEEAYPSEYDYDPYYGGQQQQYYPPPQEDTNYGYGYGPTSGSGYHRSSSLSSNGSLDEGPSHLDLRAKLGYPAVPGGFHDGTINFNYAGGNHELRGEFGLYPEYDEYEGEGSLNYSYSSSTEGTSGEPGAKDSAKRTGHPRPIRRRQKPKVSIPSTDEPEKAKDDEVFFLISRRVTIAYGPYMVLGILDYRTERLCGLIRAIRKAGGEPCLKPTYHYNQVRVWHLEHEIFSCILTDLHHGGDGDLDPNCIEAGKALERSARKAHFNLKHRYKIKGPLGAICPCHPDYVEPKPDVGIKGQHHYLSPGTIQLQKGLGGSPAYAFLKNPELSTR